MTQPESVRVPLRYEGVPIGHVEIRSTGHMTIDMTKTFSEIGALFFEMVREGGLEGLSITPISPASLISPTPKISSGYNIKIHDTKNNL